MRGVYWFFHAFRFVRFGDQPGNGLLPLPLFVTFMKMVAY